jgi:hypothetical protein
MMARVQYPSTRLRSRFIAVSSSTAPTDLFAWQSAHSSGRSPATRAGPPRTPTPRALDSYSALFGITVGICGEMAGEPLYAVLLLGLGLSDLSVSPYLVPEIKTIVRASTYDEAVTLAQRCLGLSTPMEVRTVVTEFMSRRFPRHFAA